MSFAELGLSEEVLKAIEESGYTNPTPIQEQGIPLILAGRDVIGASQTGTGKTAAFALPILSKLEPVGKPQCLVLEPTRELAHQVAESFEHYGKHTGFRVALLHGGVERLRLLGQLREDGGQQFLAHLLLFVEHPAVRDRLGVGPAPRGTRRAQAQAMVRWIAEREGEGWDVESAWKQSSGGRTNAHSSRRIRHACL